MVIIYREYWGKNHQGSFIHSLKVYMAHSSLLAVPQTHGMGNFLEHLGLLFYLEGSPMADFLSPFTSLLKCHLLRWPFLVPLPVRSSLFTFYFPCFCLFLKLVFLFLKFSLFFPLFFSPLKKNVYFCVCFLSLLYFSSKSLSAADLVLCTYLLPVFLLERSSDSWDIDVFIAVFLAVRTVPTGSSEKNKI